MKKFIENNKKILIEISFFILICLTVCPFFKMHYSIDTLEFLTNGYETYANTKFLADGRIFSCLLLKIVINLPMNIVIPVTFLCGIIISYIAVIVLKNMILKLNIENKNSFLALLVSYVTIFNFMYMDTYQFMEFPIIALGILLDIFSIKIFLNRKRNWYLYDFVLLLISIFCYQGTFPVVLELCFVLLLVKYKKINKEFFKEILKITIISSICILINLIFILYIGKTSRLGGNFETILGNVVYALKNLHNILLFSYSLYPPLLQIFFVFFMFIYTKMKYKCYHFSILAVYILRNII